MAENKFKRKLTTIFCADVAGYSRLMGDDEAATVKTLEQYKQVMSELIRQHRGRVVDSPGDNLLAEFTSVVDAVQCAVATQKELQVRNEELPEDRKMQFRIGINLGDVIEEGERIYGDGVNIAARLETLADPGGICVSKTAFDQIETKLPFGYTYLGEQTVKNIARPVGAYKVLMDPRVMVAGVPEKKPQVPIWGRKGLLAGSLAVLICIIGIAIWAFYFRLPPIEPASEKKIAFPSPEKPSIAVLPFVNMSDDPQQEYFSDGMTDDLITDLSKVSGLMVISRNSTFTYKGKPVQIKNVAQELGVKYVLEGSVRKVGDQIRINAQLIDAAKDHHLWAERYDGQLAEVFALQDKITRKIISALALRLTASEEKFLTDKGTENLQAYDEFLKGWQGYRLQTKEGFADAKIHFERAVEIDPEFARAYAAQAVMYQKAVQLAAPGLRQGLGVTTNAALNAIRTKPHFLAKKAMKKPTALAHGLMSQYYLFRWQHDEALAEIERAVAMDPNDPELYNWMSNILWFMGKNREAIESAKMGLRLEPTNPAAYLLQLAKAYLPDGNLKESSELLARVIRLNPDLAGSAALYQAIIYGTHGQNEEARTAYEIFLKSRMSPVRGLKNIISYFPFTDPKTMDSFAVALTKAGVPGSPTDYDRLSKENMINGHEVKSLLFGRKVTGTSWATGEQFSWEWAKSGEFIFMQGTHQNTGISWIEGDVIFIQFEKLYGGFPFGMTIFRNPDGSREGKNEFFMVSDLRSITPFSPTE
jgi:TolB-like protein/class 3 adenylate cyclase/Flp pilus assembly protein TadD